MAGRALAGITAAAALLLATPAAALDFNFGCGASNFECAHLTVPLDRSGTVPGTVNLYMERARGPHPAGAVFAIAGGPGQGATTLTENFNNDLGAALGSRDLIVVDQRGTGQSGALSCSELDGNDDRPIDVRTSACAERLGAARSLYTTRDSAADLEAVRAALGIDKITLFGVSYGTAVALTYAAAYPDHVERLILDSVVDPWNADPFGLDSFAAMPRTLDEICRGACSGITPSLSGDVAKLADRLAAAPLRGRFIDDHGRVRTKTVTGRDVYSTIRAADLDPSARAEYPAAIHAAVTGDPAALIRLEHRFDDLPPLPPDPTAVQSLSFTLQAATLCEEAPLPWDRGADPATRDRQAAERAAATPDARFEPFDRATALFPDNNNLIFQCRGWPAAAQAPTVPEVDPDVPVLIFEGLEDTRTPLEVGVRVAARFPQATVVKVPKTAHAVVGRRKCSQAALRRFFAARPVGDPCAAVTGKALLPLGPTTVVAGQELSAVKRTLDDLFREAALRIFPPQRSGGLRAGFFVVRHGVLDVRGYSYVRGLAITGRLSEAKLAGSFTARGSTAALRGRLTLTKRGTLSGTLGGKRVLTHWRRPPSPLG